jgi:hypothetical protein
MRSVWFLLALIAVFGVIERRDTGTVSAEAAFSGRSTSADRAAELRRDVYANEIAPAIADYRIDPYGKMYERHAPDTALLQLGEPENINPKSQNPTPNAQLPIPKQSPTTNHQPPTTNHHQVAGVMNSR